VRSLYIIVEAARLGVPRPLQLRMANVAVDALVGRYRCWATCSMRDSRRISETSPWYSGTRIAQSRREVEPAVRGRCWRSDSSSCSPPPWR
jgi:hypothetical protein